MGEREPGFGSNNVTFSRGRFRAHYRHQYRDLILLAQIAIAIHSENL